MTRRQAGIRKSSVGTEIGSSSRRVADSPAESPEANVAQLFVEAVHTHRRPDALKFKRAGAWHSISHDKVYDDVRRLALGLGALGVQAGDRVAILSENRPEWLLSDFACVMNGAVSVPLYPVLPAEQIEYQLRDCEASLIFVSNDEQLAKIRELKAELPALKHVITYEQPAQSDGTMSLREVLERGESELPRHPDAEYRQRALSTDPHDILTIIYTSGTTGRPKGVMLTHNNLASNVSDLLGAFEIGSDDVSLSVLPLCHIYERTAGHYVMFKAGVTICYAESFAATAQNLREMRPTVMTMVPRGYEKMYERVQEAAREGGRLKQRIVDWAAEVGGKRLDRRLVGQNVGPWLEFQYRLAHRLVFSKLHAQTGGRLRFFFSGGAPLSPDIARFFLSAGLTILEGYGLTETSPVIAFNTPDAFRLRSVGRPIRGVEVAIAEDGEILTRGPHVMKGYYKMPEATAEAIDSDGWFHTGDVGHLDDEGFLFITDRKKELIVTAGGKNIAPQPIENRVKINPYVNQVVMVGDRRKFPALLIVPNVEQVESWARSQQLGYDDRDELLRNEKVMEFLEDSILSPLSDLARYQRPKKIALLPAELTVEEGELTPTLKVKRRVIEEKYKVIIEELYGHDDEDH